MKRTLIQCLHQTFSGTHTRKKHKKRSLSSWTKRCPAAFEGIYTSLLLTFLKLTGVFKMSSPSRVISVTKFYESLFPGVVLLSLFVAGLQNSLLIRVECNLSTIPTCVNLPGEFNPSAFTFRYKGVLHGHLLFCRSFLHFLAVFGTFLITGYLFCDLFLGSVFLRTITIICINNKINEI